MNRSDLVERLAAQGQLSGRHAEQVVNLVLEAMAQALVRGDRIEVRNFGSFVSRYYRARHGRNPRTGAGVQVPAKRLPAFKVGKALRQRIDADIDPDIG